MDIVTKNKTVRLVFTTRKIVNISNILKGKNFEELYFSALNDGDLDALSKIVYAFAEEPETGIKPFKSGSDEVYDFIDDYKQESGKTYEDIYKELAVAINEEGFFRTKMTKKQLEEKISDPLSGIDMNQIIKSSTEKAISKVAEEQVFQGYKA